MDNELVPVFELMRDCLTTVNEAKQSVRKIKQLSSFQSESVKKNDDCNSPDSHEEDSFLEAKRNDYEEHDGVDEEKLYLGESLDTESKLDINLSIEIPEENDDDLDKAPNPDEIAKTVLKDFANEVAIWRKNEPKQPQPSQYSTYLTEKYLCKILDPLPKSKLVSLARKAIALEVEKINKYNQQSSRSNSPRTVSARQECIGKNSANMVSLKTVKAEQKISVTQSASVLRRQQIMQQRREYRKHQEKTRNKHLSASSKRLDQSSSSNQHSVNSSRFTNTISSDVKMNPALNPNQTAGKSDIEALFARAESQEKQLLKFRSNLFSEKK